jgi:hypothetical protein
LKRWARGWGEAIRRHLGFFIYGWDWLIVYMRLRHFQLKLCPCSRVFFNLKIHYICTPLCTLYWKFFNTAGVVTCDRRIGIWFHPTWFHGPKIFLSDN